MKQIVVLGGGISGYGSAILAKKKGFGVFLSDAGRIADRYKAKLDEWDRELSVWDLQGWMSIISLLWMPVHRR